MAITDKPKVLIDDSLEDDNSGDEEEEEDEVRDEHQKPLIDCETNNVENVIPLSIGKIKIFKPRRRNRFLIKKYFKLCSIISVVVFFTIYLYRLKDNLYLSDITSNTSQTNCDRLATSLVWNHTFPMLTIESALRLVDVDNDTVLDIIVPFGTGLDASSYDLMSCQIYFNQTKNDISGCGGGVMAVNGRTGQQMWVRYTPHELFASNCNIDITGDGIKDCIFGGRMAGLYAIDSSTGDIIWKINSNSEPVVETSNFYTPLYIPRDIDGDGVPDIVVIHGGDPLRKPNERTRIAGRLIIMSAKTGSIVSWSPVPDSAESYYSPQLLMHPGNVLLILYGTGGETHAGALYAISFDDLYNRHMNRSRLIYRDCCKGVMVPPVLIDINEDDVLDLVMSLFNSTVIAFDGLTFKEIWRTEFPNSETYSTPAVGYFNNDTTPDFAVIYQFGPGFPIYHKAQFTVLDGRNGKHLLEKPIDMLIGTQSSPLTISTTAKNDLFLYWYSSCQLYENITTFDESVAQKFKLAPGTTIHDQSRADFCKLRYNSTLFTQLRGLSPTNHSVLYDSRDHQILNPINYTAIGLQWIQENLAQNDFYDQNQNKLQDQNPDVDQQYRYQPSYQEYRNNYKPRDPYSDGLFDRNLDTRPDLRPISYDRIFKTRRRFKRHVGVHDGEGIQRVISTGTLAPPLNNDMKTIDIIFGTFWFPPANNVRLLSPEVETCIARYMDPQEEARLRLEDNTYFKRLHFDHDSYEEAIKDICAEKINKEMQIKVLSDDVNNLVKDMGEMTLFRLNLKCVSDQRTQKVGAIKEFAHQMWPSYMGANADSIIKSD